MVAVEVRQGTLRPDGRGLCSAGPAGNTGRKEGRKEEEEGRRQLT